MRLMNSTELRHKVHLENRGKTDIKMTENKNQNGVLEMTDLHIATQIEHNNSVKDQRHQRHHTYTLGEFEVYNIERVGHLVSVVSHISHTRDHAEHEDTTSDHMLKERELNGREEKS